MTSCREFAVGSLVVLGSTLLGGCPLGPVSNRSATPSPAGYWLVTELTADDVLAESSIVEFWHIRTTGTSDEFVQFEITDACKKDQVLARGTVSPEGTLDLVDANGNFERTFAEFVDDHEIVGTDWTSGHRLVAQRIEEPDCSMLPGGSDPDVHMQHLEFVVEEDEELVAAAAKVRQQAQGRAPNGLDHLNQARGDRLPLGNDFETANNDMMTMCQNSAGNTVECPANPDAGHAGLVECSVQNWSESRQQQLMDVIALGDSDQIYPGALVQGSSFAAGSFSPITIPRAGGRVTLSGLTLAGAGLCPGLSTPYTACAAVIAHAEVTDAIARILQNSQVQGTAADASLSIDQVYSAQHFAFKLGVDVSATELPANISGKLSVDQNNVENIVVLQFTQVFYTVAFEPPQRPFSVFRDGEMFDDPDDQIGEDNAPLYVSNVKYGRQVFLFARSRYGASLVEAALKGAASAEAANVMVDGSLTYQDIMARTSVTYVVRGGDAGLALAPIDAATTDNPNGMFDAVKSLLANRQAATFSASNPGVPVSYTLRYLTDNKVALTSYAITYDRRDCRTYPATDYHYSLRISNPKQSAWIYLDNTNNLIAGPYRAGTGVVDLDLNESLTDAGNHTLIIQLYARCGWESASAKWNLRVDGASKWSDSVSKGHFATCDISNLLGGTISTLFPGQVYEARLIVSRRTGKAQLVGLAK